LRRFGVVMATYGIDGEVTGILGVLGPTRMSYWRSISSVRYMARLMSDLMEELYSAN
jgi:heat-inducible transcriptional repressor